jgi:hypothetical protein
MSDVPIKKNVARTIFIPGLVSQADTKLFQVNPTIASGDFKYSLDGGAWTNLATLPDVYPASGTQVRLQLAQAELNGDQLDIRWSDAAGAEWCDGSLMILTATLQTGDAPVNSAGVATILADYARRTGDYATVTALSTLQGNVTTILADYARRTGDYATVTALSTLQGNVTTILADYARRTGDYATVTALSTLQGNVTTILADYARRTGDYSTVTALSTLQGNVTTILADYAKRGADSDTLKTLSDQLDAIQPSGNGGDKTLIYTLTDSVTSLPVVGATVELYPTNAYSGTPIDSQVTNVLGQVTFSNLVAGTYYPKGIRSGYTPSYDVEVVA